MELDMSENFRKDLFFLGISLLIGVVAAGAHNLATPDEPVNVGLVEIDTYCAGLDAGFCLGIQRQTHTTYNYDNYTDPEPGTDNYYRLVESELMAQAYNICNGELTGMEWTPEASFDGKTAAEWLKNENVQLLPCEKTFYRELDSSQNEK